MAALWLQGTGNRYIRGEKGVFRGRAGMRCGSLAARVFPLGWAEKRLKEVKRFRFLLTEILRR